MSKWVGVARRRKLSFLRTRFWPEYCNFLLPLLLSYIRPEIRYSRGKFMVRGMSSGSGGNGKFKSVILSRSHIKFSSVHTHTHTHVTSPSSQKEAEPSIRIKLGQRKVLQLFYSRVR